MPELPDRGQLGILTFAREDLAEPPELGFDQSAVRLAAAERVDAALGLELREHRMLDACALRC